MPVGQPAVGTRLIVDAAGGGGGGGGGGGETGVVAEPGEEILVSEQPTKAKTAALANIA